MPWTIDGQAEVEVAYLIAKGYWGQGLGTEAARAVLGYGFAALHFARLICLIEEKNAASVRVATNIGMTFERVGSDDKGSICFIRLTLDPCDEVGGFPGDLLDRLSVSLRAD